MDQIKVRLVLKSKIWLNKIQKYGPDTKPVLKSKGWLNKIQIGGPDASQTSEFQEMAQ
jgi:hypothetical protein